MVQVDAALILAASALEERHQLSFWDALIIEAARRGGARRLVSEDLQAGRRIAGLVIEKPARGAAPLTVVDQWRGGQPCTVTPLA